MSSNRRAGSFRSIQTTLTRWLRKVPTSFRDYQIGLETMSFITGQSKSTIVANYAKGKLTELGREYGPAIAAGSYSALLGAANEALMPPSKRTNYGSSVVSGGGGGRYWATRRHYRYTSLSRANQIRGHRRNYVSSLVRARRRRRRRRYY